MIQAAQQDVKLYYTRHHGGLTLVKQAPGKPVKHMVVTSDHPNFSQVLHLLSATSSPAKRGELAEKLEKLLAPPAELINMHGVSRRIKDSRVFVRKGKVYFASKSGGEQELDGTIVDRILDVLGKPQFSKYGDSLLRFMNNLKSNVNNELPKETRNTIKDIRGELYEWLKSGKTPITNDGCFLAYKYVNKDFMDCHTQTMDNSPGNVVRMKQAEVDPDRHNLCSTGLHFCSRSYLPSYDRGYRVVIVKVNPRHVFAIPTDHNFQKGRASEYYVVGELKGDWTKMDAFKDSFVDEDSKFAAMPDVTFASGWLRPSLEKLAESYGLCMHGKVMIVERRGRYVPVKVGATGKYVDIMGVEVEGVMQVMSIETKSVKVAVRLALNKVEGGIKS